MKNKMLLTLSIVGIAGLLVSCNTTGNTSSTGNTNKALVHLLTLKLIRMMSLHKQTFMLLLLSLIAQTKSFLLTSMSYKSHSPTQLLVAIQLLNQNLQLASLKLHLHTNQKVKLLLLRRNFLKTMVWQDQLQKASGMSKLLLMKHGLLVKMLLLLTLHS